MRKLLSVFLVFVLVGFQIDTIKVSAAQSGDYTYSVSDSSAVITGYSGSEENLIIPSQLDGYTVTSIGDCAFFYCLSLNSVTIPNSVTSISKGAFEYCFNLKSITIPNGVTSIDNLVFHSCTSLTSITIPKSVTSIGDYAFGKCSSLTNISIPNSVTSIGNYGFQSCTSLTSITIPKSVTSIGNKVFDECSSNFIIYYYRGSASSVTNQLSEYKTVPCNIVSYNGNGNTEGTVPVDNNMYTQGSKVTISGNTGSLVKTGYTFAGWNTKADGSGISYSANTPTVMDVSDITLYAQWTIPKYTVTFDSNGGSIVSSITNVISGTKVTLPAAPTKTGYTFSGWNTAKDGSGTAFTAATPVNANITLYAQWTLLKYTVTFDSNGGSDISPITNVPLGTKITLPASPTKTGYTFAGWNTAKDGSGTAFTALTPVNSNITVYAQWIPVQNFVSVKGDFNGDNVIGITDLSILRTILLSSNKDIKYDVNGDNKVDVTDYLRLKKMIITFPLTDTTNITGAFIDDNFRNAVYTLINKNSSDPILYSDVKNIQNLNLTSMGIKDLNGIEYFTSLKSLYCGSNQLTCVNVRKNTLLTTLDCSFNNLPSIDLSRNTLLTYLDCNNNQLTALDVSKNTKLIYLNTSYNKLTALYVSNNAALTYLNCSVNNIAALNVINNTALTYLSCSSNKLTTLDISKNASLIYLFCEKNQLATLYSTKNTWDTIFYKTQYTDSTHTTSVSTLVITIKK